MPFNYSVQIDVGRFVTGHLVVRGGVRRSGSIGGEVDGELLRGRRLLGAARFFLHPHSGRTRLRSRDQFTGFHSAPFAAFLTPSIMTTLV